MEPILAEWEAYARSLGPASDGLSIVELRDHAETMLLAIALDIESTQTRGEQIRKSRGTGVDEGDACAASEHGDDRYQRNFTLVQMASEFRALRASVLRLWSQEARGDMRDHLEDMTRFNEAVDQALAESVKSFARRTEETRDMFDAILGHDLRGPLASIALSGELLSRPGPDAAQVALIGTRVQRSARVMGAMVDDLLSFARVRLGNGLPVDPTPVDIATLCRDAIDDANAMHPGCRIELETSGRSDARLDGYRLHQLLVNLLGNACQHGASNRPVHCSAHGDDAEVVFRVANAGKPIREQDLERVFLPLVRLAGKVEPSQRTGTSLGLGLHIASEIAKGHGGTIAATSTDERTEFVVRIPR